LEIAGFSFSLFLKRCKTESELQNILSNMNDLLLKWDTEHQKKIGAAFWKYFKDNWLCEAWRDSWLDLGTRRLQNDGLEPRVGLWNTNNISEAIIRLGGDLIARKKVLAVSTFVERVPLAFLYFASRSIYSFFQSISLLFLE